MDPANVSPFVGYLLSAACVLTGEVFPVSGSRVQRIRPWSKDPEWKLMTDGRWTADAVEKAVANAGVPSANTTTQARQPVTGVAPGAQCVERSASMSIDTDERAALADAVRDAASARLRECLDETGKPQRRSTVEVAQ